jgi:hypothetical protein
MSIDYVIKASENKVSLAAEISLFKWLLSAALPWLNMIGRRRLGQIVSIRILTRRVGEIILPLCVCFHMHF